VVQKVGLLQLSSRLHGSMAHPSPSVTALLKGEQLRQEVFLYRVSRGGVCSADTKNQRMESRTSVKIT